MVEKVSEALGVDCGCEKRKNWLNERFRYRNIECMTPQQAENWPESLVNKRKLTHADMDFIAHYHADLFKHKLQKPCTCSPSEWQRMINDIDEMYQAYKADNATT